MQFKRALWIVPFVGSLFLTSFFYTEVRSESGNCTLDEDHLIVTYVTEEVDRSDIYAVQADSFVRVNFTYGEEGLNINPSWSPSGIDMTFQSNRDGNWEIYGFSNGHTTNLTQNAADDTNPVWSPDGSRIAFVSNRDGSQQIYTFDFSDSSVSQVITGQENNYYPIWSPDGHQLAFFGSSSPDQIFLTDLTTGATKMIFEMSRIGYFAWSPDGTQIAFPSSVDEEANSDIYLLMVATGEIVNLTNNSFSDVDPRWSPDGSKILFGGNRGEKDQIFVMDRDGQNVQNLSSDNFNNRSAAWSPTGLSIAFESTRETTDTEIINSLYRMSADGTNIVKLADHVMHFSNIWRPCQPK